MITGFSALVSQIDEHLAESAWRDCLGEVFESFREEGLLRPTEPAETVLCRACFEQHWLPVESDPETGGLFVICPIGGRSPVNDAELTVFAADRARCLGLLQGALGAKPRSARELIPGKAWYLGQTRTASIDWNALFVPGPLTGRELVRLAEAAALLPRYMLDLVLTGDTTNWPDIPFARPLHSLGLAEVAEWSAGTIRLCDDRLGRCLQSFLAGRRTSPARGGRPPNKAHWLRSNWSDYRTDLEGRSSDTERARLLSNAYGRAFPGGTLSRNTVVTVLDEVMPDRVKNCQ